VNTTKCFSSKQRRACLGGQFVCSPLVPSLAGGTLQLHARWDTSSVWVRIPACLCQLKKGVKDARLW
jgi:hypothetical protein